MATEQQMQQWMTLSGALLRDLKPAQAGLEIFGTAMPAEEFAALTSAQATAVDSALIAMATAQDEYAVRAIAKGLGNATVIALFSRWAHYTQLWSALPSNPAALRSHWFPPTMTWRAVLLAMVSDPRQRAAACKSLWGEACAEWPQGLE
ncbi:MAG: hypothetical protein AB1832_01085 [Pseudomonadota bacterium]